MIFSIAVDPLVAAVGKVPDAIGLKREDAGAAHLFAEQSAGEERLIAGLFSRQTNSAALALAGGCMDLSPAAWG